MASTSRTAMDGTDDMMEPEFQRKRDVNLPMRSAPGKTACV